ncbi:MAG: methyltransferase domain-containing protein [Anaerolineae bacterium]|nr:methyltransferase domain-containing protein [Anaerolineae bacterium]
MPLLDHFSVIAPYYDVVFFRANADLLDRHVQPRQGDRLLDVGGGTGRVAQFYLGKVAQVCILDPSPKMLAEGRRKGICITQGESEQIPFPAGMFDRIIMIDAFHHLRDQAAAARELLRVLSSGGRLVIEEPDIVSLAVKMVALGEKLLLMRSHFLSPEEVCALFAGDGVRAWVEKTGHTAWVIVEKA